MFTLEITQSAETDLDYVPISDLPNWATEKQSFELTSSSMK